MGSREKMNEFLQKNSSTFNLNEIDEGDICTQRIRSLVDDESFVEINQFVKSRGLSYGFDRAKVVGDGVVVGYGTISGRLVFIASQDPTVYAGSMGQMHAEKISGIVRMAIKAKAPFIGIYDTGGARIEEGILALEGLSSVLSAINEAATVIPVFAAILGPCPGGSAFVASLSHFRFMTEQFSGLYINGPMMTAAVEGKTMDPSEIGGATVHATKTGLASVVCKDEDSCMDSIKDLLSYFTDYQDVSRDDAKKDDPNRVEIRLDEIAYGLDHEYHMNEIIELIVDKDSCFEISGDYAKGIITTFARMDGITVGIVANKSKRMDSNMMKKAATFISFCDTFNIPLITFVDCEGFAIGITSEHSDIIKSGADLYRAMDFCRSPRIGILVGKAFGTAYLTLASKQSGCDFVFAWPTSEVSIVSPDTAANIIYKKQIASSDNPILTRAEFVEKYSNEIASAYVASSLGHVDEVIMPSSTRPRLISSLQVLLS
ncbi:MAG: acyl-CoA carboxylase subunit beta [Saccharofermentanales bacterium]